jgi:hypothetical protein
MHRESAKLDELFFATESYDLNTAALIQALPHAMHAFRVLPQVELHILFRLGDDDRNLAGALAGVFAQAFQFFGAQFHRVARTIVRMHHIDGHPAGSDVRREVRQCCGLYELRVSVVPPSVAQKSERCLQHVVTKRVAELERFLDAADERAEMRGATADSTHIFETAGGDEWRLVAPRRQEGSIAGGLLLEPASGFDPVGATDVFDSLCRVIENHEPDALGFVTA